MNQKLTKKQKELIAAHDLKMREIHLAGGLEEQLSRGLSVTVGTAFGGVVEMSMRRLGGGQTWIILQPVEVVELINQLGAAIGCHVLTQPRRDFASWRSWKYSEEELAHFRGPGEALHGVGHPPHAKAIEDGGYGSSLPEPEEQPGMPLPILEERHDEAVAVEAPEQRRKSKRTSSSS